MDARDRKVVRAIGRNLAAERSRSGLTQEQVADRMGVQVTQYARLEQGDTDSGISKYVRAAQAIGAPYTAMFHGLEEPG
ncbi:MAG: helix-turn-helix transcriptional regulator [Thermoleophilia bacterium]|nr:helix-turn-helix transcriptional regulator [Thermoleophilia bacterium]